MGMGSAPAHATVISWDNLKKLCPKECEALEKALDATDEWTLDGFAQSAVSGDIEEVPNEIYQCWDNLLDAFTNTTATPDSELFLSIGYYDREQGDRYDDLQEGAFFMVDGVWVKTPAAEKLGDMLEEKSWTVFG